jgi:hypothetical protein
MKWIALALSLLLSSAHGANARSLASEVVHAKIQSDYVSFQIAIEGSRQEGTLSQQIALRDLDHYAQVGLPFPGPGGVAAAATYAGPGDIVSGAILWGSCSRVYNAASASTSTQLCDLVAAAAPTTVLCTLRGSSTGYIDLTNTYCAGAVTPPALCAAQVGGICNISKVYDQTGHSNHLTQTGASAQPKITFSALNGLPGIKCSQSDPDIMNSPAITQAQPYTYSSVFERTANPTNLTLILGVNGSGAFGMSTTAAEFIIAAGTNLSTGATVTENAFHAAQGVFNSTSSIIAVDSITPTTGNAGTNGYAATALRFCRNSATLDGLVMEIGLWPSAFNSTQYGNMNTNQHSATVGYNF